jgi:hypothetical protein
MAKQMIALYQIDSFLRNEYGFINEFPLGKSETVYHKGDIEIRLPMGKNALTEDEIVGKILSRTMFERLLKYIEKTI